LAAEVSPDCHLGEFDLNGVVAFTFRILAAF